MSFIIGTRCISDCDTGCVDVCPVDCIHGPIDIDGAGAEVEVLRAEGKLEGLQLFIDPDVCIDCGACVPACPPDAIYDTEDETIDNRIFDMFGREHNNYKHLPTGIYFQNGKKFIKIGE